MGALLAARLIYIHMGSGLRHAAGARKPSRNDNFCRSPPKVLAGRGPGARATVATWPGRFRGPRAPAPSRQTKVGRPKKRMQIVSANNRARLSLLWPGWKWTFDLWTPERAAPELEHLSGRELARGPSASMVKTKRRARWRQKAAADSICGSGALGAAQQVCNDAELLRANLFGRVLPRALDPVRRHSFSWRACAGCVEKVGSAPLPRKWP